MQFVLAAYDADVDRMIEIFDRERIRRDDYIGWCEELCGPGRCDNLDRKDFRDEKACDRYGFNGLLFSLKFPSSELNNDP